MFLKSSAMLAGLASLAHAKPLFYESCQASTVTSTVTATGSGPYSVITVYNSIGGGIGSGAGGLGGAPVSTITVTASNTAGGAPASTITVTAAPGIPPSTITVTAAGGAPASTVTVTAAPGVPPSTITVTASNAAGGAGGAPASTVTVTATPGSYNPSASAVSSVPGTNVIQVFIQTVVVPYPVTINSYFTQNTVINFNGGATIIIDNAPTQIVTVVTATSTSTLTSTVTVQPTESTFIISNTPVNSVAKRQSSIANSFLGDGGAVENKCTAARQFTIQNGQLFSQGEQVSVSLTTSDSIALAVSPIIGNITGTFSASGNVLVWENQSFFLGAALFCLVEDIITAIFTGGGAATCSAPQILSLIDANLCDANSGQISSVLPSSTATTPSVSIPSIVASLTTPSIPSATGPLFPFTNATATDLSGILTGGLSSTGLPSLGASGNGGLPISGTAPASNGFPSLSINATDAAGAITSTGTAPASSGFPSLSINATDAAGAITSTGTAPALSTSAPSGFPSLSINATDAAGAITGTGTSTGPSSGFPTPSINVTTTGIADPTNSSPTGSTITTSSFAGYNATTSGVANPTGTGIGPTGSTGPTAPVTLPSPSCSLISDADLPAASNAVLDVNNLYSSLANPVTGTTNTAVATLLNGLDLSQLLGTGTSKFPDILIGLEDILLCPSQLAPLVPGLGQQCNLYTGTLERALGCIIAVALGNTGSEIDFVVSAIGTLASTLSSLIGTSTSGIENGIAGVSVTPTTPLNGNSALLGAQGAIFTALGLSSPTGTCATDATSAALYASEQIQINSLLDSVLDTVSSVEDFIDGLTYNALTGSNDNTYSYVLDGLQKTLACAAILGSSLDPRLAVCSTPTNTEDLQTALGCIVGVALGDTGTTLNTAVTGIQTLATNLENALSSSSSGLSAGLATTVGANTALNDNSALAGAQVDIYAALGLPNSNLCTVESLTDLTSEQTEVNALYNDDIFANVEAFLASLSTSLLTGSDGTYNYTLTALRNTVNCVSTIGSSTGLDSALDVCTVAPYTDNLQNALSCLIGVALNPVVAAVSPATATVANTVTGVTNVVAMTVNNLGTTAAGGLTSTLNTNLNAALGISLGV